MTPVQNQPKRFLPVAPKEKIFNEWAAVMRHQDEMDMEAERMELVWKKQAQEQYWEALAQQMEV